MTMLDRFRNSGSSAYPYLPPAGFTAPENETKAPVGDEEFRVFVKIPGLDATSTALFTERQAALRSFTKAELLRLKDRVAVALEKCKRAEQEAEKALQEQIASFKPGIRVKIVNRQSPHFGKCATIINKEFVPAQFRIRAVHNDLGVVAIYIDGQVSPFYARVSGLEKI